MFDSLHGYLRYLSSVGIVNEFHKYLLPVFYIFGGRGMAQMLTFTKAQIVDATARADAGDEKAKGDFLSRLMEVHKTSPEKLTHQDVFITCMTNIGAGSDTTSISLCAVLHALMTHPEAMAKLREEVEEQVGESLDNGKGITFQEAQKMPYLQACIKEALRLHPATGLPLARVVPPEGAVLAGQHFPGGVSDKPNMIRCCPNQ